MDRRQKKTRAAIFEAFGRLLEHRSYNSITVQEIIDGADIGRSTFYAHFETKDDLLRALCEELFGHVIHSAAEHCRDHGGSSGGTASDYMFLHLFQHLAENDNNILGLLSGENNGIFMRYFKDSLTDLVLLQLSGRDSAARSGLPEGFLVNHISSSFVETVLWWIRNGLKESPEEISGYFRAAVAPFL